ncbi:MAG: hypothetical protein ACK4VI_02675 [Alphaproteobacteria bacterium]
MTVIDLNAFKTAAAKPPEPQSPPQQDPEPTWETPRHRYASRISGVTKDGRPKADIYREMLRNVMKRNMGKRKPKAGIILGLCEHRKLRREVTKAENRDFALQCLREEMEKAAKKPTVISTLLNVDDPEDAMTSPPSGAEIIALTHSRM